jgi:hypothetical protein
MKTLLKSLTLSLLLLSPPGLHAADESVVDEIMKSAGEGFSELERRIINRYYSNRHGEESGDKDEKGGNKKPGKEKSAKKAPPGLAGKEQLPPGLQMQLEKNGTLPPGLAGRDLPGDLDEQLGKPPRGYERTIIDNDILLVEAATRKVVDIISDVVLE